MSDQQPAPGWYPDPVQRHAERFWDGSGWTARIRDGVIESIDPHWDQPTAAPSSTGATTMADSSRVAATAGTPSAGGPFDRTALVAEVGRPRPLPSARETIAAAGGIIALVGILVVVGWTLLNDGGDGRAEVGILGVIALAGAYAWALVGPRDLRAAALGGAVVGPLLLVGSIFAADSAGRGSAIAAALTLAVAWGAMFAGPGFTGAPILLAGAVLSLWGALLAAVTTSGSSDPYYGDPYYGSNDPFATNPFDLAATVGVISLFFAFACVAVAGIADSRGAKVLGTPLLAVAVIQSWVGLSAASTNGVGVAFLSVLVGGAFVVVGTAGERRGSLWIGALTATSGLTSLVIQATDEPVAGGVLLLALGAILVAAAPAIEGALRPSAPVEEPAAF